MQRKTVTLSQNLINSLTKLFVFRDIPEQILISCLQGVEEIHLLKNELIFRKGESYHKGIYFILAGSVDLTSESDPLELAPGDALGITTFLGKTMYTATAIASTDSDILFIDEYSIYSLMDKAPEFRAKFMKIIVERLNNLDRISTRTISLSAYQSVGGCMSSPLITVHNSKSVAEAAKIMEEHNIGAIVVMNRKHVLKGLLSARHLAQKYLSNAVESPEVALAENYANPMPLMLPQEYPLVEALAEMLRRGEDYALITRRNKPAGIISKSDIMGLLSNGSDVFGASIARINDIEGIKKVISTLPKIAENMMNNTSIFREFLPTLSSNHLVIQKRIFELAKQKYKADNNFDILSQSFCILSLGSLARREMTLTANQNHAMVMDDGTSDEDFSHYQKFAKLFSDMLNEAGYYYHNLGMSLNNPDMIKRMCDWDDFLSVSVHKSNEKNIPHTRILFDCERFEGDEQLLWDFKDAIYGVIKEKTLLFGRLMNYQSNAKIPISQFGSFITQKDGEHKDTIDLKENALDFISYTAQAFALYSDILDTNTVRRIDHLGRKRVLNIELVREAILAYESIVDIMMHEQLSQISQNKPASYRIRPQELSMYSQEQLKRALHIIARFFGEGLAFFK